MSHIKSSPKSLRNPIFLSIKAVLLVGICGLGYCNAASETDGSSNLSEWQYPLYSQRYVLKVEVPGVAGRVNLQSEPTAASLILPLKTILSDGVPAEPEPILLLGEDGGIQPVALRHVVGSDYEITFQTQSGLRRFCLYTGANSSSGQAPPPSSPLIDGPGNFEVLGVKLRGRSAPASFLPGQQPCTLEMFQNLDAMPDNAQLGVRHRPNSKDSRLGINDPECPYFMMNTDPFGRVTGIRNPLRYTALYEAFLRTPVSGDYKFALDTCGVAFLLIDGKPVIEAGRPDPLRSPFHLQNVVALTEGVHRVVLYYADANAEEGKTNVDLSRFGIRMHWQTPFSNQFMCVPSQAFVSYLPAIVEHSESSIGNSERRDNPIQPFIQLENLGQVRFASHLGGHSTMERVLLSVRVSDLPQNAQIRVAVPSILDWIGPVNMKTVQVWAPAGKEVLVSVLDSSSGAPLARRTAIFPTTKEGARDVLDLEAELSIKAAPDFLYPDETGYIHVEALLSPVPVIISKERLEEKLLPPPPRPMGEFQIQWRLEEDAMAVPTPSGNGKIDATPSKSNQKKCYVPVSAASLEEKSKSGGFYLILELAAGGVDVQVCRFRLLHATSQWPGTILSGSDKLLWRARRGELQTSPNLVDSNHLSSSTGSMGFPELERVLMLVPRESEAEYRRFAPLKALAQGDFGNEVLFLGDPLVEDVSSTTQAGLVGALARALPAFKWNPKCISGPFRYLPVFRILADFEEWKDSQPGKIPSVAVISLGGGDVARQTPLHSFQRALDVLVDRLRLGGVKKIIIAGVIPEPMREAHCEPYQERVDEVLREHHLDGVDIFREWMKEKNWVRHYSIDGAESSTTFAPVPNAQAIDLFARMIKNKF